MTKRAAPPAAAPPLPGAQPTEEYTDPGARAGGTQVQPGVNDGTFVVEDAENEDEEEMVSYHGGFGRREITREQWIKAGVSDQPTTLWERRKEFKVPKSVFGDKALQVLRQDPDFRVP